MVTLFVRRHYSPYLFEYETINEALNHISSDLDEGWSFPHYIEKDGVRIWEFSTLASMDAELEALKEAP